MHRRCVPLRGDLSRATSTATDLDAELVGPAEQHAPHVGGPNSLDEDEQHPGLPIEERPASAACHRINAVACHGFWLSLVVARRGRRCDAR